MYSVMFMTIEKGHRRKRNIIKKYPKLTGPYTIFLYKYGWFDREYFNQLIANSTEEGTAL